MTIQHKGLYFRSNSDGTFTVKSTKTNGKVFKQIAKTFAEATEFLYNMADNNEIGNEMCEKLCKKFGCDRYGNEFDLGY